MPRLVEVGERVRGTRSSAAEAPRAARRVGRSHVRRARAFGVRAGVVAAASRERSTRPARSSAVASVARAVGRRRRRERLAPVRVDVAARRPLARRRTRACSNWMRLSDRSPTVRYSSPSSSGAGELGRRAPGRRAQVPDRRRRDRRARSCTRPAHSCDHAQPLTSRTPNSVAACSKPSRRPRATRGARRSRGGPARRSSGRTPPSSAGTGRSASATACGATPRAPPRTGAARSAPCRPRAGRSRSAGPGAGRARPRRAPPGSSRLRRSARACLACSECWTMPCGRCSASIAISSAYSSPRPAPTGRCGRACGRARSGPARAPTPGGGRARPSAPGASRHL